MKPKSATPGYIAAAGAAGVGLAWILIWAFGLPTLPAVIIFLAAGGMPMWVLELRRASLPARLRAYSVLPVWRRKLRLVGLGAITTLFVSTIIIFREVAAEAFSGFDRQFVIVAPLSFLWMVWILSRKQSHPGLDSIESCGRVAIRLIRRPYKITSRDRQCVLGWLVKAFYLPLMLSSTYLFLDGAAAALVDKHGVWRIYTVMYLLLFAVDTAFATIGYCSTSRRINTHIRSSDPTLLGWAVALVCYPPFNLIVLHKWLSYRDGLEWHQWLSDSPVILALWGGTILLMVGLYVAATVSFGLRFSNLTNRGIITSGPYRYFKHPSYLGKNIAWWLISVPFVSNSGPLVAATHCCALLTINGIYLLRAKTEERHLMQDAEYQIYSDWISQHGVFAKARRACFFGIRLPG